MRHILYRMLLFTGAIVLMSSQLDARWLPSGKGRKTINDDNALSGHRGRRKSKKRVLQVAVAEKPELPTAESLEALPQESMPVEEASPAQEDPVVSDTPADDQAGTTTETPVEDAQSEVTQQETAVVAEPKEVVSEEPQETVAPAQEEPVQQEESAAADVTSVEEPVKEAAASEETVAPVAEPEDDVELIGIDTVDIDEPAGNWLYKRIYWEKAEYRYEKIKALMDKIVDVRMYYFDKQAELDKNVFDPFYLAIGIKGGRIDQVIKDLLSHLDTERAKGGTLDGDERELLQSIQQERSTLEKLQRDVASVQKIDQSINEAVRVSMDMVNQARGFEKQAWNNFKMISRELSDKKAHNLYYGVEAYWRNMKEIYAYLSGDLRSYFDQLVQKVKEQTERITTTMKSLKEKGVDLKERAAALYENETARAALNQPEDDEHDEETAPVKKVSWWRSTLSAVGHFFSWIGSSIGRGVSASWSLLSAWWQAERKPVVDDAVTPQEAEETDRDLTPSSTE